MILVLFYAVGIFSFLVNFQSTEDFSLSRSEVKESSTNVQKDDVIIPDEEKVSWQTVFENYVAEQQALDANFTYHVQGNGTQANPWQISNAMDLAYYQSRIAGTMSYGYSTNKCCVLTDDIVLNDGYFEEDGTYHDGGDGFLYEWNSINLFGMQGAKFYGNGHTISGLYKNALFYSKNYTSTNREYITGIDFRDFTVKNAYVDNETSILFPTIVQNSKFENINCYGYLISDSDKYDNKYAVGGIFGYLSNCEVKNCSNYALVKHITIRGAGGLAGQANNTKISNCANYGLIIGKGTTGGIAGNIYQCSVINCKNEGDIDCETNCEYVAGIAGHCNGGNNKNDKQPIISNCVNSGNIKGNITATAGIVGQMTASGNGQTAIISNCVNRGKIISGAAGIVGMIQTNDAPDDKHCVALVDRCVNEGELADCHAGIVYNIYRFVTIQNCVNYANISSVSAGAVGGICNTCSMDAKIVDCINYGNVYARMWGAGILAGSNSQMSNCEITGCVNKGNVVLSNSGTKYPVGGIVGLLTSCRNVKISQCRNEGTIIGANLSGQQYVGGIVGLVDNMYGSVAYAESTRQSYGPEISISKTQNKGKVVAKSSHTKSRCAGIIGGLGYYSIVTMRECVNDGEVRSVKAGYGLFCGNDFQNKYMEIVNCANRGKITSSSGAVYAIGTISAQTTYVENCYSSGEVQGNNATANYFISGISVSQIKNSLYFGRGVSSPKYYGADFSGFYCNRLTGEIGLNTLDGNGPLQKRLTVEDLTARGLISA